VIIMGMWKVVKSCCCYAKSYCLIMMNCCFWDLWLIEWKPWWLMCKLLFQKCWKSLNKVFGLWIMILITLGVFGIKISVFGLILREIWGSNTHLLTFHSVGAAIGELGAQLQRFSAWTCQAWRQAPNTRQYFSCFVF